MKAQMLSNLTKAFHNVKHVIQTNVINPIASNLQQKPTLGKVRLNNRELEEIKLISQGGYAYIFHVRDTNSEEVFALKKMICQDNQRLKTAKNEINILRSLPPHSNLLKIYDSKIIKVADGHHAYILLEYCEEGTLFDLMMKYESTKLNEKQIIFIMREVCDGVKALHSSDPPIFHRDIKIENTLLHHKKFKLCDFGSCTSKIVDFGQISQKEYSFYEEEYDKSTTLMYRPPEMCDPYLKYVVSDRVDIWMLGCMLFTLCFYKQPFQESSKLSIVNASFTFPKDHSYPEKLIDIIRMMLTPNPEHRPSIFELSDVFADYFVIESIKLNPEAQRIKDEATQQEFEIKNFSEQKRATKHEENIPIEEIMSMQQKIQQSRKKKNKTNSYEDEDRSEKKDKFVLKTSHGECGPFAKAKPVENNQADTEFGYGGYQNFSQNETNQQRIHFDFESSSNDAAQAPKMGETWNYGHWETPLFDSNGTQDTLGRLSNQNTNKNIDLL